MSHRRLYVNGRIGWEYPGVAESTFGAKKRRQSKSLVYTGRFWHEEKSIVNLKVSCFLHNPTRWFSTKFPEHIDWHLAGFSFLEAKILKFLGFLSVNFVSLIWSGGLKLVGRTHQMMRRHCRQDQLTIIPSETDVPLKSTICGRMGWMDWKTLGQ